MKMKKGIMDYNNVCNVLFRSSSFKPNTKNEVQAHFRQWSDDKLCYQDIVVTELDEEYESIEIEVSDLAMSLSLGGGVGEIERSYILLYMKR